MDQLKKYDDATRNHIIDIGLFNYEKCLEYNLKNTCNSKLSNWINDEEVTNMRESNKKLKQNIEELNGKMYMIRNEEQEKGEKNVEYFKNQLTYANEEKRKLLNLRVIGHSPKLLTRFIDQNNNSPVISLKDTII